MATQTLLYGTLTAYTLTGASLGSFAAREGTVVSNSANLAIDIVWSGHIVLGAAVSTGDAYILASSSDGTDFSTPATGTDAAITIPGIGIAALASLQYGQKVPGTELYFVKAILATGQAAGATMKFGDIYLAACFGGNIPLGGIAPVLVNCTGQALSATATVFNRVDLKYTIA